MLKTWMLPSLAGMMLLASSCSGSYAQTEVRATARNPDGSMSVSYFYDDLGPYGRWINDASYGWSWTPYDMPPDWRPYSNGYWVYSDCGWTWASYEPWGWATYHYGRWAYTPDYGWIWLPGTEWAPAWVAWRYGDGWVGWAPLPPSVTWQISGRLSLDDYERIPAPRWCFVQSQHLLDENLRFQVLLVARNVTLLSHTHDATRYEMGGRRPVDAGVDVALIEKMNGRRVERVKLVDADESARGHGPSVAGGRMSLFRPTIRPAAPGTLPRPGLGLNDVAVPDAELQNTQREDERRKLESSLARERQQLDREHERELRSAPIGAHREEIVSRQEAEDKAFQDHMAQARQVHEQRMLKKIVKPGRAGGPDQVAPVGTEGHDKKVTERKNRGHGGS